MLGACTRRPRTAPVHLRGVKKAARAHAAVALQIVKTATLLRANLPADALASPVPLDPDEASILPRTHSHRALRAAERAQGYVHFAPSERSSGAARRSRASAAAAAAAAAQDSAGLGRSTSVGDSAAVSGAVGRGSAAAAASGSAGGTYGDASWSVDLVAPERSPKGAGIALPISPSAAAPAAAAATPQPPGSARSAGGATTASWASDLPLRPLAAAGDDGGMRIPSFLRAAVASPPAHAHARPPWPPPESPYAHLPPAPRSDPHASRHPSRSPRAASASPSSPGGATTASWASDLPLRPLAAAGDGGMRLPSYLRGSPGPASADAIFSSALSPSAAAAAAAAAAVATHDIEMPPSPRTPEPVPAQSESFHASTALLPSSAAVDSAEAGAESSRFPEASVALLDMAATRPAPPRHLPPAAIGAAPIYSIVHGNPSFRRTRTRGVETSSLDLSESSGISIGGAAHEEFLPALPTLSETYARASGSMSLALAPSAGEAGRMWPEAETAEFGYRVAAPPASAPPATGGAAPPTSGSGSQGSGGASPDPRHRRPLPLAAAHLQAKRLQRGGSDPNRVDRARRGGGSGNARRESVPAAPVEGDPVISLSQAYAIATRPR